MSSLRSRLAAGIAMMLLALVGCLDGLSQCGDLVCPRGLVCVTNAAGDFTGCGDPESVAACEDSVDGTPCDFDQIVSGSCQGGLCVQAICGNGHQEGLEACDESADNIDGVVGACNETCTSDQTCGNGFADLTVGENCDPSIDLKHDGCDSCQSVPPLWRELELRQHLDGHVIAHNPVLGQTVLFGGEDLATTGLSDRTLEWTGRLWREIPTSKRPVARRDQAMVYDAARGQIVLFGGSNEIGTALDDTWLWDGGRWARAHPAVSPPALAQSAMTYDPDEQVVWLFGGTSPNVAAPTAEDGLWKWDGQNWEQVATEPPSGRYQHSMTFDPVLRRVITCGGRGVSATFLTSCVAWDGSDWTTLAGTLPSSYGTVLADPRDGSLVFITRNSANKPSRHVLQGSTWEEASVAAEVISNDLIAGQAVYRPDIEAFMTPAVGTSSIQTFVDDGSSWRSATNDVQGFDREDVFAAYAASTGHSLVIVQAKLVDWDGSAWEYLEDPKNGGRRNAAMSPGPRGRAALYFGGVHTEPPQKVMANTEVWNGDEWLGHAGSEPQPRAHHSMAFDRIRGETVLFGGSSSPLYPSDDQLLGDTWVWSWQSDTWETREDLGAAPSPRIDAAMTFDEISGRVMLFGGTEAGRVVLDDLWEWDGTSWVQSEVTGTVRPPARTGALFVYDPNRRRSILHGGTDEDGGALRDAWEWNGEDGTWTRTGIEVITPRVSNQAGVYNAVNARVVIGGGTGSGENPIAFFYGDPTGDDRCDLAVDVDGDLDAGCEDIDCWAYCQPFCPPGSTETGDDATDTWPNNCPSRFAWCVGDDEECGIPHCGDGACNAALENHRNCQQDCPVPAICGDFACATSEDSSTCPGDCPP